MKRMHVMGIVAVALFGAACGGSSAGETDASDIDGRTPMPVDAGADADYRDAEGPITDDAGNLLFGPGVVLDRVALAESGHSWSAWAPLVNPNFNTAINDGTMILLVEFRRLDDPSGQNDPDVDIAIYAGTDPDADASNNFTGDAMLRISQESLDLIGNPRALLTGGSIVDGHLTGSIQGEILFFLPGIGGVKIQDPVFSGDLVAANDNQSVVRMENATLDGVLLARHLEEVTNPVTATCLAASMLDLVALPCLSFDGVQPDVDRDDDGLEWFEEAKFFVDGTIDTCHDGNGQTYVSTPGVQCVLDPSFQDAYTATIEVSGVRAFLLPPL